MITTLQELTTELQTLCHEGQSMAEPVIEIEGFTTALIKGIEVVKDAERVLLKVAI